MARFEVMGFAALYPSYTLRRHARQREARLAPPGHDVGRTEYCPQERPYQVASTEPLNFSSMNAFTSGDW